ncbi:hypothetical protein [Glaciecola sp. 1036]|uniref:hypothetical protein n=1 Tax=Alteromonadaceae TaxID=72275 RepID=UPI003D06AD66
MTRLTTLLTLAVLSMFVFVEIASARLVRSSGRGSLTEQVETRYFFIEDADIVRFSDNTIGMSESAYLNRNTFSNIIGGAGLGISAVPTTGPTQDTNCNGSYDTSELEAAQDLIDYWSSIGTPEAIQNLALAEDALAELETGDPCVWEFAQNEDLLMFGPFSVFFDSPLIDTMITWEISGNGRNEILMGEVNDGGDITTPDGLISYGNVFLNTPQPALDLGDYNVNVTAQISSNFGEFFFERTNTGTGNSAEVVTLTRFEEFNPAYDAWVDEYIEWEETVYFPWLDNGEIGPEPVFTTPEPPMTIVGYRNESEFDYIPTTETLFRSEDEILRITAAANDPNFVSAPVGTSLTLFGLGVLYMRRRMKSAA